MKNRFFLRSALLTSILAVFMCMTAFGEVGVTDSEIRLGSHLFLSGPAASWGIEVQRGMEMKIDEVNAAGGIHGRKLKLFVGDSAYNPAKAITVTNKMINHDKVFLFIGNMGTITAGATKPLISRKKIPQLFPLSSAELFFKPYDRYSFGGFVPYYDQARVLVQYFAKQKGKKRFAILYQDDDMGSDMLKGAQDQLAELGMKLVAAESYKRGSTVFSTQVAKIKRENPDMLILGTIIRETVAVLAEANKLKWDVTMSGMTPCYNAYIPLLAKKAGFSADGLYSVGQAPYPYKDHANPLARKFYKDYEKRYGKGPDAIATAGYQPMSALVEVLQKVGRDLTREKVVDELETWLNKKDEIFDGVPVTFTPTSHKGPDQGIIMQLQNDKWTRIEGPVAYQ